MEIAATLFHVFLLSGSGFSENVFSDVPEQGFGIYGAASRKGALPSSSL